MPKYHYMLELTEVQRLLRLHVHPRSQLTHQMHVGEDALSVLIPDLELVM